MTADKKMNARLRAAAGYHPPAQTQPAAIPAGKAGKAGSGQKIKTGTDMNAMLRRAVGLQPAAATPEAQAEILPKPDIPPGNAGAGTAAPVRTPFDDRAMNALLRRKFYGR